MAQQEGTTVDDAAVQIFSVEHTRQPPISDNAAFEREFSNPERNTSIGWRPGPHLIRNYQILDAVLDGAFRGLFNAKGFIRGTGYLIPEEHMATIQVDEAHLVRPTSDSTIIIGCNVAFSNYFHWITQCLPAIDFTMRRIGDRAVALALPVLNAWQEESLRLLGYHSVKRVTVNDPCRQYFFNRVEFSEILNGRAAFTRSETTYQTYSRLREAVEPEPASIRRKLYVARTDAPSRRMRNEDAVIAEVRKRGFDVVVPGTLTLAEQIRLFRSADTVVGAHGAGLTNIVFCEPDTIVYELRPAHYPNPCFCNLAYVCGLRYWADDFESEGEGLPNLREWESDTPFFVRRLDEVDAVYAQMLEAAKHQTISAMEFLRGKPGLVPDLTAPEPAPVVQAPPGLLRRLGRMLFGR